MKAKLVLMSLVLLPWGMISQAWGQCPCNDKETIAINQAYHKGQLAVTTSVLSRLSDASVISFAKVSAAENQAMIQALDKLVIDAGLEPKHNDIEKGFTARASQATAQLSKLSGVALDRAYIEYVEGEAQLLLTAFDTYFIPQVVTPTMKAWTKANRPKIAEQYSIAKSIHGKLGEATLAY